MIQVYHGDGKGKTTAAMGLALRMLAAGRRVVVVQFLKDGESGRRACSPSISACPCSRKVSDKVYRSMTPEELCRDVRAARWEPLPRSPSSRARRDGLLVLDEALDALSKGLVDEALRGPRARFVRARRRSSALAGARLPARSWRRPTT